LMASPVGVVATVLKISTVGVKEVIPVGAGPVPVYVNRLALATDLEEYSMLSAIATVRL